MYKKILAVLLSAIMVTSLMTAFTSADEKANAPAAQESQSVVSASDSYDADGADLYFESLSMTEEEFWASESSDDLTLFSSDVTCLGDTLSGMAADIYTALSKADLTTYTGANLKYSYSTTTERDNYYYQAADVYGKALYAYLYDHPETVKWSTGRVGMSTSYGGGTIILKFYYYVSSYYTAALGSSMDSVVDEVVKAAEELDEYSQLKYFHDWLVKNNEYYTAAVSNNDDTTEQYYIAHTQYGCLLKGKGVCESYAKAFQCMCNAAGLTSILVSSSTHAWNYVYIDGEWYMVDCTWDDPVGASASYIGYKYFLVSNNPNVDSDHTESSLFDYPATSTKAYTYDPSKIHTHTMTANAAKEATCTEEGNTAYWSCSGCGKYFSDAKGKTEIEKDSWVIPAKGHTVVTDKAVEPTCTETGLTEGSHCSVCNTVLVAQNVVAALGHKLTKTEAKEATYTEAGNTEYYTCSVCGRYFADAEGKTEIEKDSWVIPVKEKEPEVKSVYMYRLYNPNTGEHLYTSNQDEVDFLTPYGWQYEGVAWQAPETSDKPVYRLYNPNSGDHHYTMNKEEKDWLVSLGWSDEGVAWYSGGDVPVYRLFNPNATMATHHYTAFDTERDWLFTIGWQNEKIAWYAISVPEN